MSGKRPSGREASADDASASSTDPAPVAALRDALLVQPAAGRMQRLVRVPPRVAFWAVLRSGLRLRVEGQRREGPAVVVSNHPNLIDGLIVLLADPTMRPIARWHRVPPVRAALWVAASLITTTGTPVSPHRGAFAPALAHLREGGRVWIAPEGVWQPAPTLRYPRTGAVRLAHAAGVPVQVLGIVHDTHPGPTLSTWRGLPRPGVVLRWGPILWPTGDVASDIDAMMVALGQTCGGVWEPSGAAPDDLAS